MDDTVKFLEQFYRGFDREGVFVITHLWKTSAGEPKVNPRTFRYPIREIPNIDWGPHIEANTMKPGEDRAWDIYFGGAVRAPGFLNAHGNSRGGIEDCILSTALSTDIDFFCPGAHKGEKLPANIEEAAGVIGKQPDPSILVDSGYGVHLHHVYTEDVVLNTKLERQKYGRERKKCQSPYKKELERNGWALDKVWGVDRIWRLPGFNNWKLRDTAPPREVKVLYGLEGEIEKYDQQSLVPFKTTTKAPTPPVTNIPEGKPGPRGSSVDELRRTLIAYGNKYHDDALAAAASADPDRQDEAEDIAARAYYIKQLLAGESIEEKGNRDAALTVLCGIICRLTPDVGEFSDADLNYIVGELFKSSLQAWDDDDEDTDLQREMEKVIDKLRRIKAKDSDERAAGLLGLRKALNQHQFGKDSDNKDSNKGGSEEGEAPFDGASDAPPPEDTRTEAQLLKVGLITYGAFVYCWDWVNQRYYTRPTKSKDELMVVIRECWPEDDPSCPFKYSFVNEENRVVEMPLGHLQRQYGSSAEESHYSFLEQQTVYKPKERSYIINPAPWRFTEPQFNPEIDAWLKLLGGAANYDLLCDWLAGVTRLDRPCAVIYFDGPPGCGKSIFAHGAAQIWTEAAPLYEEIAGSFNDALMVSPVILIDEGFVATDVKNPTMLMRRLVAQGSHSVNVKFGPKLKLKGHLRFVVAANNDSVFLTGKEERLSENDSRAMAERIAYVKVDEAATNFFVQHNKGNRLTSKWLGDDGLFAKHVLWLRDNRSLADTGRFLVEGKSSDMHEQFLFQGNERNLVLEWIVRFCEAPAILNGRTADDALAAEIGDGLVVINTKLMKDNWKVFFPGTKEAIDHSHVLRHLKSLSHQQASVLVKVGSTTIRYWPIDIDRIISYAESHDIGDIERIKKNAERETKLTVSIINSKNYKA